VEIFPGGKERHRDPVVIRSPNPDFSSVVLFCVVPSIQFPFPLWEGARG
jgi:hypothetical protein